jgi:DNA-3-methyladenine glycosylase II
VKGVGRWTAEMFLIFHELRADVLPVDDIGLRARRGRALQPRRSLARRNARARVAL